MYSDKVKSAVNFNPQQLKLENNAADFLLIIYNPTDDNYDLKVSQKV